MRFPPRLFWALLAPLILLSIPYAFSVSVMTRDPSSSLESRGAGILIVVALLTSVVELVAVPVALFSIGRHARYRTPANFLVAMAGMIPVVLFVFFVVVILYGHG